MNYEEARIFIKRAEQYGSVLGLDNIRNLLDYLGNPQDELRFIHIAGTNGKGSVLAYISTVLTESGYRTGRYISPAIFSYRERIQIDNKNISRQAFADIIGQIKGAADKMVLHGYPHPTPFELETAAAFLYFREHKCDMVVLETGLGGLEDATNIVKTGIMEIFTPISLDHMQFLGNTLHEIAEVKAGIIKENTQVISGQQKPAAAEILERVSREKKCRLCIVNENEIKTLHADIEGQRFLYRSVKYEIKLAGSHQIRNAALAIDALEQLGKMGYTITAEHIQRGLAKTVWNGRFSVLMKEPLFIIDGAHNEDAAIQLYNTVREYFSGRNIYFIMGVFGDKEYDKIIKVTVPIAKHIYTVQTKDNPRALDAYKLSDHVRKYNSHVTAAVDVETAVRLSLESAGAEDIILAFGSLSFLKEIVDGLKEVRSEKIGRPEKN